MVASRAGHVVVVATPEWWWHRVPATTRVPGVCVIGPQRAHPWVPPAALTLRAEDVRTWRRYHGDAALSCEDIQALTLHPSVFVWAPDLLFPSLKIENAPRAGANSPMHGGIRRGFFRGKVAA